MTENTRVTPKVMESIFLGGVGVWNKNIAVWEM